MDLPNASSGFQTRGAVLGGGWPLLEGANPVGARARSLTAVAAALTSPPNANLDRLSRPVGRY